jgi:hypothetical protein
VRAVTYDPLEHMEVDDRVDWEVRQHLYAQRRLADLEERGYTRVRLTDEHNGTTCWRPGCNRPAQRWLRLTADVPNGVCKEHDPLHGIYWGAPCPDCGRD